MVSDAELREQHRIHQQRQQQLSQQQTPTTLRTQNNSAVSMLNGTAAMARAAPESINGIPLSTILKTYDINLNIKPINFMESCTFRTAMNGVIG